MKKETEIEGTEKRGMRRQNVHGQHSKKTRLTGFLARTIRKQERRRGSRLNHDRALSSRKMRQLKERTKGHQVHRRGFTNGGSFGKGSGLRRRPIEKKKHREGELRRGRGEKNLKEHRGSSISKGTGGTVQNAKNDALRGKRRGRGKAVAEGRNHRREKAKPREKIFRRSPSQKR